MLERLQKMDRRVLYLLIAVVIGGPLLLHPRRHPRVVLSEVTNAFETIDRVPKGKVVLVSIFYGAGTLAENGPQTEAVFRHMFQKHIPFVVLSWDLVGTGLSYDVGKKLEKELGATYGRDWVHLGYRPGPLIAVISGMAEDFPKVMRTDRFGTRIADIPMLKDIKNHEQIGAVVEITPSATVDYWIAFFTNPYHVPLIYCPTAVMSVEAYPFIDSEQIVGMLNGVIGAAQYETLIGQENEPTFAAAASWALSAAHLFIIALIVVGNIAYLASRSKVNGGSA